jgi:hypothetical protein
MNSQAIGALMHRPLRLFAISVAVASAGACKPSGPEAPHANLTSVAPLRAAFNRDSGKVRAIFLASPT